MSDPLFTPLKGHPSTWPEEVEALRRRIAELEDAMAKERKAHEKEIACLEENYGAVLRKMKLDE